MPITTQFPVTVFDQKSFHVIDEKVTGWAFDIHNEFGRYLKEGLYRNELARRCEAAGYHVAKEFRVSASLDDFEKPYFIDLLVERGVIIETKTISTLTDREKGQTLNYLFLCELHHGTLLTFRTERVQHEFVSTRFTHTSRQQYSIDVAHWKPLTAQCSHMKEILVRCLQEWGCRLDPHLYRDALTHFLGGDDNVLRDVPVLSRGVQIGEQEMRLLTPDVAFAVTTSTQHPQTVLDHQRRYLRHTPLRAIQWINLDPHLAWPRVPRCPGPDR